MQKKNVLNKKFIYAKKNVLGKFYSKIEIKSENKTVQNPKKC